MALDDLRARFDNVPTTAGTPAHEIKVVLMEAAVKVNDVVKGDDMLLTDITQHLEKALHRAVSRLPGDGDTGEDDQSGNDEGHKGAEEGDSE